MQMIIFQNDRHHIINVPCYTIIDLMVQHAWKITIFAQKCLKMHKPSVGGISVYILGSKFLVA